MLICSSSNLKIAVWSARTWMWMRLLLGLAGSPTQVYKVNFVVLEATESKEIQPTRRAIRALIQELIQEYLDRVAGWRKTMTENRNVWVFIEQEEGRIAEVSLELLGKAQELAQELQAWAATARSGRCCAVTRWQSCRSSVIQYGADHVLVADHPELEQYRTLPYSRVVVEQVRKRQPYIFLFGATPARARPGAAHRQRRAGRADRRLHRPADWRLHLQKG